MVKTSFVSKKLYNKKTTCRIIYKWFSISASGWWDSNSRPPGPKPGTLTGLCYTPQLLSFLICDCKGRTFFNNTKTFCSYFAKKVHYFYQTSFEGIKMAPFLRSSAKVFLSSPGFKFTAAMASVITVVRIPSFNASSAEALTQ